MRLPGICRCSNSHCSGKDLLAFSDCTLAVVSFWTALIFGTVYLYGGVLMMKNWGFKECPRKSHLLLVSGSNSLLEMPASETGAFTAFALHSNWYKIEGTFRDARGLLPRCGHFSSGGAVRGRAAEAQRRLRCCSLRVPPAGLRGKEPAQSLFPGSAFCVISAAPEGFRVQSRELFVAGWAMGVWCRVALIFNAVLTWTSSFLWKKWIRLDA